MTKAREGENAEAPTRRLLAGRPEPAPFDAQRRGNEMLGQDNQFLSGRELVVHAGRPTSQHDPFEAAIGVQVDLECQGGSVLNELTTQNEIRPKLTVRL